MELVVTVVMVPLFLGNLRPFLVDAVRIPPLAGQLADIGSSCGAVNERLCSAHVSVEIASGWKRSEDPSPAWRRIGSRQVAHLHRRSNSLSSCQRYGHH